MKKFYAHDPKTGRQIRKATNAEVARYAEICREIPITERGKMQRVGDVLIDFTTDLPDNQRVAD